VRPLKYRMVESLVRQVLASRRAEAEIVASDFALVSVAGEGLRGRLDHWGERAERVLADCDIEVFGRAREEISLSWLVREEQRRRAVTELHKTLLQ
jgi:aspartokinase